MEWKELIATIFTGFILRLGVPIIITAVLARALRKLDLRWIAEAEKRRIRAHSLGAAVRQVCCWDAHDCPPEKRDACTAFAQPEIPCWQIFRDEQGLLLESCLVCEIFREAPVFLVR